MRDFVLPSVIGATFFAGTLLFGALIYPGSYSLLGWSALLLLSYYAGTIGFTLRHWPHQNFRNKKWLLVVGMVVGIAALFFAFNDNPSMAWPLIALSSGLYLITVFKANSQAQFGDTHGISAWQDPLVKRWITEFDALLLLDLSHESRSAMVRCLYRLTECSAHESSFIPAEDEILDSLGAQIVRGTRRCMPTDQLLGLINRFDETLTQRNELILKTSHTEFLVGQKRSPQLLFGPEENKN